MKSILGMAGRRYSFCT